MCEYADAHGTTDLDLLFFRLVLVLNSYRYIFLLTFIWYFMKSEVDELVILYPIQNAIERTVAHKSDIEMYTNSF